MELVPSFLACLSCLFTLAILTISTSLKIVPEHQRLVLFRLGRALENSLGPGIVFVIPVIDRTVPVDIREQVRDTSNLPALTRDSSPVRISIRWKYKILDPVKSIVAVGNLETATAGVIRTLVEGLAKEVNASELAKNGDWFHATTLTRLRKATEPWGMQIMDVEILNISE
ncbi:MAG TPA: SPFH domain-containing protein [Anaerolineales bacterium]|nr:SPFH domain-containing protein [Anaerolineales bacterium]HNB35109.1 SPFH domain-containing protein [Anaerolineales bacterium]HNC08327.1 SPFH domain-containing protein [Anaerolineales bacterium]